MIFSDCPTYIPASDAPIATHESMSTFFDSTGYNPYAPFSELGPPVHSVRTRIKLIPSTPLTFIASPLAFSTAKSLRITLSEVTDSP